MRCSYVFRLAQRLQRLLQELLEVFAERSTGGLVAEGVLQHVRLLLDRVARGEVRQEAVLADEEDLAGLKLK